MDINLNQTIKHIGELFVQMNSNAALMGARWKNISLGKEAFSLMRGLPDIVPGEFDTPEIKARLLGQMLERMDDKLTPRFCIEVREYIHTLDPRDDGNASELKRLRDFVDLSLSMEEYCRKYHLLLKFDPVERTGKMESVAEEVERELDAELAEYPRGMGFCFAYWHAKGIALRRRGIVWRSPGAMNPNVLFD